MLPGFTIAQVDQQGQISEAARNVLLGRFPLLTEDALRQELSDILMAISQLQLKLVTTKLELAPDTIMSSAAHNDFLMKISIDLNNLYQRISQIELVLSKIQDISTAGLKTLRTELAALKTQADQLMAKNAETDLFDSLILTKPLSASTFHNTTMLPNGAATINYYEDSYNNSFTVASVEISRPNNLAGYDILGTDPVVDYSVGSYSCLIKGMANGVWYENAYCITPDPDGISYTITINFRNLATINGLYYSLIDRTNLRAAKIEGEVHYIRPDGVSEKQWATAVCGGVIYDYAQGWDPEIEDPMDLPITGFLAKQTLYSISDNTALGVSALRITMKTVAYEYEAVEELANKNFVPTRLSDLSAAIPQTVVRTYARYKIGAYYITPYQRRIVASSGAVDSPLFEPSHLFDDRAAYSNRITPFVRYKRYIETNDVTGTLRFYVEQDESKVMRREIPVTFGQQIIYYNFKDDSGIDPYADMDWESVRPLRRIDVIDTTNDANEQLMGSVVMPAVAPYLDSEYWYNSDKKKWRYVSPKSFSKDVPYECRTDDSAEVISVVGSKLSQTDSIVEYVFGSDDSPIDSDIPLTLTITYTSTENRQLFYKFIGKDKTSGADVMEDGDIGWIAKTGSTPVTAKPRTMSLRTKNAVGTLKVYIHLAS